MECLFCGNPSDSGEHVIPGWLQQHYRLMDLKMSLVNRTTIPYRKLIIDSCSSCNTKQFSQLESKISKESGTFSDYYLWGLKIHWGLMAKNSMLPADRSDRRKGTIVDADLITENLDFARLFFKSVSDRETLFRPSPFGSVILLDISSTKLKGFELTQSYVLGCLAITLKSKLLIVFFNDRQAISQAISSQELKDRIKDRLSLRFFLLEAGYLAMRREDIPHGVLKIEGKRQSVVISPGSFTLPQLKQFDDEEFSLLAPTVGIEVNKIKGNEWTAQLLKPMNRS